MHLARNENPGLDSGGTGFFHASTIAMKIAMKIDMKIDMKKELRHDRSQVSRCRR